MKTNEELHGLELYGFGGESKFTPSIFDKTQITNIRAVIKQYYSQIKILNDRHTSYGLKHDIESYLGTDSYITNGELIYAMYLEGYKVKNIDNNNACFNVGEKGVKALKKLNQQNKS